MSLVSELFPWIPAALPKKRAVAVSPTSAEAIKAHQFSGKLKSDKQALLDFLNGNSFGMTAHEISSKSGIAHSIVHKRLPDLRRDGLVRNTGTVTCSVTGRHALCWMV